jgi:hypothetical protein
MRGGGWNARYLPLRRLTIRVGQVLSGAEYEWGGPFQTRLEAVAVP